MDKNKKEKELKTINNIFSNINSGILTTIEKLNANDIFELRKSLYKKNIKFKVIKNNVAKIVIKKHKNLNLTNDIKGSLAIAWSNIEINSISKIVVDFQDKLDKQIIKSGFYKGNRIDLNSIKFLSKVPNINILKSRLMELIQMVPSKLLAQISTPASNITTILTTKNKSKK